MKFEPINPAPPVTRIFIAALLGWHRLRVPGFPIACLLLFPLPAYWRAAAIQTCLHRSTSLREFRRLAFLLRYKSCSHQLSLALRAPRASTGESSEIRFGRRDKFR